MTQSKKALQRARINRFSQYAADCEAQMVYWFNNRHNCGGRFHAKHHARFNARRRWRDGWRRELQLAVVEYCKMYKGTPAVELGKW